MEKLTEILKDLEQGKISADNAEEQVLRLFSVISCVCPNEIKTGTVAIHCCNLCGKPDEDWWSKH
jgi:hypothetical protein